MRRLGQYWPTLLVALLVPQSAWAQLVVTGDRVDLSHAGATRPMKIVSTLPTGITPQLPCAVGDMVQLSTAPAAQQVYINTTNGVCTWVQQTGGGSGGGGLQDPGSNGMLKRTALNITAIAAFPDIVSLFGGCSGVQYLGADGNCHNPSSGGGGLADPGSNGVIKRTSLNVTAPALFGDIVSLFGGCSGTLLLGADGNCHPGGSGGLGDPGTNGVVKRTALDVTAPAISGDIIGLFTGCSGTMYLGADGSCHTASGGGAGNSYVIAASSSPQAISASTHGQGINADTFCFSGGITAGATTGYQVLCNVQKDSSGNVTVTWAGTTVGSIQIFSSGAGGGGGGGTPGGSNGQVQYNNSGAFGGFSVGGDGTLNTATGNLIITKTNGVSFAPSATTDTTNAINITSGILTVARGGSGAGTLSGILKGNGTSPFTIAGSSDIVGLFGGCSGTLLLGADGACHSSGANPYITNATTSPQTITATTHGQGINPIVMCYSGATSAGHYTGYWVPCAYEQNPSGSAGDMIISYTSGEVGSIWIGSAGTGTGGGGGTPGGTNGQVQFNNAGAFGGFTVSGDGTLNTSTGVINITSTHLGSPLPVTQGGTGAATITGPLKGNGTSAVSPAAASDIVALFSTCSGSQYLGADGVCHNPTGGGTVTTTGTMTSTAIVTSAGGNAIQTPSASLLADPSGDIIGPGAAEFSKGFSIPQGSDPGNFVVNSFQLVSPVSIPTAYRWVVPSADAAGVVTSDGNGTPGHLSISATNGTGNILRASAAAPATSGTSILKGNGSGGTTAATSTDVVSLFSTCSGTQYLGADGSCHSGTGLNDPGSNGIVKRTALNVTAVAASSDVIGLFSGCTGTNYLGADGACHTASITPGGTTGQIQFNNVGTFGGFTVSGDGTINTSTGVLTVTKTGGVAFAASATVDTTNAGNITSGILQVARGGTGASTLSGVLKGNGTGAVTSSVAADVVSLFSGCSGTQYLGADGACHTGGGGGGSPTGPAGGFLGGTYPNPYKFNDIRNYGATCNGSNQHTAILSALTSGLTSLYIPAGCNWTVPSTSWTYNPGTGTITVPGNSIPGGINIEGENWVTSTITVASPTVSGMYIGPMTLLRNLNLPNAACAPQDYASGNYVKGITCPIWFYMNAAQRYSGTVNTSGTTVTWISGDQFLYDTQGQYNWVPNSLSNPTPQVNINGTFYTASALSQTSSTCGAAGGNGANFGAKCMTLTASAGTQSGVPYYFDQYNLMAADGYQMTSMATRGPADYNGLQAGGFGGDTFYAGCNEPGCWAYRGSNAGGSGVFLAQRLSNGQAFYVYDTCSAPYVCNAGQGYYYYATTRTGGELLRFDQSTTNFAGEAMYLNMAQGSGSFTGNFFHAQNNGVDKAKIDASGNSTFGGFIQGNSIQGNTSTQITADTIYFGNTGQQNFFIDRNYPGTGTNSASFIFGYNTPKSNFGGAMFTVYDNSTDRHLMMQINSAGSSSGSDGVQLPTLPTSAGGGGLYVCVDSSGNLYKKSSCP